MSTPMRPPISPDVRRVRRAVAIGVLVALVAVWVGYLSTTDSSSASSAQALVDTLRGSAWAAPAFVAVYAIRPLILFPATLLTVAGGVLFGPVAGIALTVVAANLSAMVAYGFARGIASPPQDVEVEAGFRARWSKRLRERSFTTVMIMRLALLPYDLVNYLCGFLHIPAGPFLVATAIGSFPATVAFVLAGASVERVDAGLAGFDARVFAASVVLFVVSLAIARILQRSGGPELGVR